MDSAKPLSESLKTQVRELANRYPDPHGTIIPALYLIQAEQGYVSADACRELAEMTEIPAVKWWETATFYTMIRKEGVGKYLIGVCMNVSCSLLGSKHLLQHLKDKLGVNEGETTADGLFTFERVECLCCCGNAPVITVNDASFLNLTEEKLDQLLDQLRQGRDPHAL